MALYKVEICGVNTAKLPLIPNARKQELLEEIAKGNQQAREEFIYGNLRLVLSIIGRFSNTNENVDDLFQIGCIGLMKAVDNFDLNQQVKFSTYAVPMIMGEIRRYLRDNNSIRVSRSVKDIAYKAIYAKEVLTKQKQREPTIYEPVYQEGGDTLYVLDQIKDKKNKEEKWVEDIALKDALIRLPKREQNIIGMRFFQGKTQMEVAEEIGISQAQVSRLEKSALKSMRNYLRQ
jgi:RNA polymerase sporulation-specific sigma factor